MSIKERLNNTTGIQRLFLVSFTVAELFAIYSAFDDARDYTSHLSDESKISVIGNLITYTAFILLCFTVIFITYKVISWVIAGFKKKSD